jgi:hypothetical protein
MLFFTGSRATNNNGYGFNYKDVFIINEKRSFYDPDIA